MLIKRQSSRPLAELDPTAAVSHDHEGPTESPAAIKSSNSAAVTVRTPQIPCNYTPLLLPKEGISKVPPETARFRSILTLIKIKATGY